MFGLVFFCLDLSVAVKESGGTQQCPVKVDTPAFHGVQADPDQLPVLAHRDPLMTASLRQRPALYDGGEQELCDVSEGRFLCLSNSYTHKNRRKPHSFRKSVLTVGESAMK